LLRMEKFFTEHHYENVKDYKTFFEKYLLLPPQADNLKYEDVGYATGGYMQNGAYKKGFSIRLSDEPEKIGANGFYSGNLRWRNYRVDGNADYICINNKLTKEQIEKTLCHELIHFLVMADLDKNNSDKNIFNGGFINEGLTEKLTDEIYPEGHKSYLLQVDTINYANILTDNDDNFRAFLSGNVDFGGIEKSDGWNDFVSKINKYHYDYINNVDKQSQRIDYIKAQRQLIELAVENKIIKNENINVEEYVKFYEKVMKHMPIQDTQWIKDYFDKVDEQFVSKCIDNGKETMENGKQKIKEIRGLIDEKGKSNPNNFVTVQDEKEFRFSFNEGINVYLNGDLMREGWNGISGLAGEGYSISMENEKITIENKNGEKQVIDVSYEKRLEMAERLKKLNIDIKEKTSEISLAEENKREKQEINPTQKKNMSVELAQEIMPNSNIKNISNCRIYRQKRRFVYEKCCQKICV